MRPKLSGYTLVELMVVLIVSSLLVMFIYKSMEYINTYHRLTASHANMSAQAWKLAYMLQRDFTVCTHITSNGDAIVLAGRGDTATYYFGTNTSRAWKADTTHFELNATATLIEENGWNRLNLNLVIGEESTTVSLRKRVDVYSVLTLDNNAD